MSLTELFKNFTLLGAEWVLWLLVALSILSIGVMIERFMFFRKRTVDTDELGSALKKALNGGDSDAFVKRYEHEQAMAARVAVAGIREQSRGVEVVSEVMNSEKVRARGEHERLLVILGTLGNNAPFIGLFGTVLGIIKAFDDLRKDSTGGADVVHGGISEALVATAVGLLVAIPAVIAFNYFNRRVREALTGTDEIAHVVLGELHGADRADA
jgi:biopolymer transport protein ExbB